MLKITQAEYDRVIERCLAAFLQAGSLELSLDQIALQVGVSKRMLIHYFSGREVVEDRAMSLLEDRLRAQFTPGHFPPGASLSAVVTAVWERTTALESRGVLLLIMDLSRRAWNGSRRAQAFYAEQQRLWLELLLEFSGDRPKIEDIVQLFQGAVVTFLITGDAQLGAVALQRLASA
jgi:AcrR family transcriptional regulator